MASTYLNKTFGSAGDRKTFTFSTWLKRSALSSSGNYAIYRWNTDAANRATFQFANDSLLIQFVSGGSFQYNSGETTRKFRDTNSWYHLVVSVDTTDATQADRVKLYVNGVQETLSPSTNISQNADTNVNIAGLCRIGADDNSGSVASQFDGSMAHVHFIDGTAYDASAFGQTDSASGIWKPKTSPSVTYGTNGFFLDFANSSDLGNDVSGNNNDFTMSGTGTQTLDTPSNVFATFNSIHASGTATHDPNFSQGNTSVTFDNGDDSTLSTLGVSSGKYYAEFKITNEATGNATVGAGNESSTLVTNPGSCNVGGSGSYGYYASGQKRINGGSLTAYGDSFTTNDIIGIALDLDNGAIWFSKNGTWQNSATIAEIEAGTTTNAAATGLSGTFFFGCSNSASSTTGDAFSVNFGNGYFGTTAVSTPESDSAGLGKFEYSVPSGYYALCTKNIAVYG